MKSIKLHRLHVLAIYFACLRSAREMLIFLKLVINRKNKVQSLYQAPFIIQLMQRDIKHIADNFRISISRHVNGAIGEFNVHKQIFYPFRPNLHQALDIWHVFRVRNVRRHFLLVEFTYRVNPGLDFFRLLFRVIDSLYNQAWVDWLFFTCIRRR